MAHSFALPRRYPFLASAILMLAWPSLATKQPEAACCSAWKNAQDACGSCTEWSLLDQNACAGTTKRTTVWCPAASDAITSAGATVGIDLAERAAVSTCCFWAPTADTCGTCQSQAAPNDWCAQSASNCNLCAGSWCDGAPEALEPTGEVSTCCFWAPTADKCGTCQSAALPTDWCAQSAANCGICSGTWCRASQTTTVPTSTTTSAPTTAGAATTRTGTSTATLVPAVAAAVLITSSATTTTSVPTTTTIPATATSNMMSIPFDQATSAPAGTSPQTTLASGSTCCFWAPTADKCGTCQSAASATEWCAQSAANCVVCTGTWCANNQATLTTATVTNTAASGTVTQQSSAPRPVSSTATQTASSSLASRDWVEGTYVTGYWDCCKPSCSWPNKGNATAPVRSCKADGTFASPNDSSICDGGVAGSCTNNQPWIFNDSLSLGFAAAAVSGLSGLMGDVNCGQCYQLVFTDRIHSDGNWGGSDPLLVGKSHVVQITNIGYDVTGSQSFDLQIPGAGQGIFSSGCERQFPGSLAGDFDCNNRFGGCGDISGCALLPAVLRAGCEWRYTWFKWLASNGKTNNPYVRFRRVRCPKPLTSISGSVALDDGQYPVVV